MNKPSKIIQLVPVELDLVGLDDEGRCWVLVAQAEEVSDNLGSGKRPTGKFFWRAMPIIEEPST